MICLYNVSTQGDTLQLNCYYNTEERNVTMLVSASNDNMCTCMIRVLVIIVSTVYIINNYSMTVEKQE